VKWDSIEIGNYRMYAVVTDNDGKTTTSSTVNFEVVAPIVAPPEEPIKVKMVKPYNNQVFHLSIGGITLKASTNGDVKSVRFFNWFSPLPSVNKDKLEFNWKNIAVGSYFVYAEITDSKGKVIFSDPISFTVQKPKAKNRQNDKILSASDSSRMGISNEIQKSSDEIGYSTFGIKMGPNPTSSYLTIFFEDYPLHLETTLSIIDMRGIEMMTKEANTDDGQVVLDVKELPHGVYIVKLILENKHVQTKKLIVN